MAARGFRLFVTPESLLHAVWAQNTRALHLLTYVDNYCINLFSSNSAHFLLTPLAGALRARRAAGSETLRGAGAERTHDSVRACGGRAHTSLFL